MKRKSTTSSNSLKDTKSPFSISDTNNILNKKSRKSRWSTNEYDKCIIAGMPTTIPPNMNPKDAEVYIVQLQITDITNKLQKQNYTAEIESMSREKSPDPIYSPDGKRINTKEYRARERLEDRKKQLLVKLHSLRPDLVPANEKIGGTRFEEKVFIPQDDYPDINLIGLIIGPRGLTLKELEKEFSAKIIIRGKGSVHNGKVSVSVPLPGEDELLHAYICSGDKQSARRAAERITEIIRDGIEFPELQNDLRKNQMKQLAILNGTYRETEGLNRLKQIAEAQTIVTNTIICSLCGGVGHLPRDCLTNIRPDPVMPPIPGGFPPPPPPPPPPPVPPKSTIDGEYDSFISELSNVTSVPSISTFVTDARSIPLPAGPFGGDIRDRDANCFVRNFVFNN